MGTRPYWIVLERFGPLVDATAVAIASNWAGKAVEFIEWCYMSKLCSVNSSVLQGLEYLSGYVDDVYYLDTEAGGLGAARLVGTQNIFLSTLLNFIILWQYHHFVVLMCEMRTMLDSKIMIRHDQVIRTSFAFSYPASSIFAWASNNRQSFADCEPMTSARDGGQQSLGARSLVCPRRQKELEI